jgi:hypothetical protein
LEGVNKLLINKRSKNVFLAGYIVNYIKARKKENKMLLLEYKPYNKFQDFLEKAKKQQKKDKFFGYMGILKYAKDRKREFWGKLHCKYIMTNRKLLGFARADISNLTQYGKSLVKDSIILNKPATKKQMEATTLKMFNSFMAKRKVK